MTLRFLLATVLLPLQGALQITEFHTSPDDSFLDDDGDNSDWIEIQNTGTSALSTAGFALTDEASAPTKWLLPEVTLAPGEYRIVFASKKNRIIEEEEWHANFSLSLDGEYLSLRDPSGAAVSEFEYPQQFYGLSFNGAGYFERPTPGVANGAIDFTDYVRDTKFSVDRGFYEAPFSLEITTATPDALIYYTTDGTAPSSANGTLYTAEIPVSTTTVIRAVAEKEGLVSSNVDAQTYLFLADVIHQTNTLAGFPTTWGIDNSTHNGATNQPRPADYEMDPRIITQFGEAEALAALRHHPTISVVMDPEDLWNESTDSATGGIYSNPYGGTENKFRPNMGVPRDWERPCSVEFIGFEKVASKKVNAGIRIAGNFARHPNRYKHHFRLTARSSYGDSKFRGELFSRTEVDTFDDFILRGGNSESWTFPGSTGNGPGTRATVQYIRDQFYKDAQIDMGHLSASQEFFHLYLNGAYWGFYTLIERIDAHFLSQHLGGEEEDYDVLKQNNDLSDGNSDAWNEMYRISRSGVSTPEKLGEIQEYLDLENFVDYIIFNFWAGTVDWAQNWRGGRRSRNAPGFGFQFYNWDGERGLGDHGGNRSYVYNNTPLLRSWQYHPTELHHDLKLNPEYLVYFADRVQKHLFNGGTLTRERASLLYNERAEEVKPSLIAESARWGDRQRPSNPYTTENEWQLMLNYMNETYFVERNPVVLNQFKSAGIFPDTEAPVMSQHGGQVPDGFPLLVSSDTGSVYFTADGSDPRMAGGAVSPSAMVSLGGLEETAVIDDGSIWNYNDDDVAIGTSWKEAAFDDSGWKTGAAPLGYGNVTNTVIATTFAKSPFPTLTAYFRQDFQVTDPSSIVEAHLEAMLDGGAIFYINGVEVYRDNMADGPVEHSTLALSDGNEGVFDRFQISTEHLVNGTNTLAIELHNVRTNSGDIGLDVRLQLAEIGEADLNVTGATTVKARVLDDGEWSALTEADFFIGMPASGANLVISEIHYLPIGAEGDEFIELMNISDLSVSLAGVVFDDGIGYAFANDAILAPGERLVLTPQDYTGMLRDKGEQLRILASDGSVIHDFSYNNNAPWPDDDELLGRSIVLMNPFAAPNHGDSSQWLPSLQAGGTPGASDTQLPLPGADLEALFFSGPPPVMEIIDGAPRLVVSRNLAAGGANLIVEVSPNLIDWQPGGDYEGMTILSAGESEMKWSFPAATGKQFVRTRLVVEE